MSFIKYADVEFKVLENLDEVKAEQKKSKISKKSKKEVDNNEKEDLDEQDSE